MMTNEKKQQSKKKKKKKKKKKVFCLTFLLFSPPLKPQVSPRRRATSLRRMTSKQRWTPAAAEAVRWYSRRRHSHSYRWCLHQIIPSPAT